METYAVTEAVGEGFAEAGCFNDVSGDTVKIVVSDTRACGIDGSLAC